MPPSKVSGLGELELDLALTALRKIRSSVVVEEVPGSDPTPDDTFSDQLIRMILTLNSRVDDPLSLSFSAADPKTVGRVNIVRKGLLLLHPGAKLREAIVASRNVGSDKLWSNDNMYRHLSVLVGSFIHENNLSSRMVIDTFFLRSTAMVAPQKAGVMLETQVSNVHPRLSRMDTISGVINYTAVVAESSIAHIYAPPTPSQCDGGVMSAFFAAEAKTPGISLTDHLPQIVLELVARAKQHGKSHVRGALTTGYRWQFIVVDLDTSGDGASYWVSQVIEWRWKTTGSLPSWERVVEETSDESDPALIAGILSSWIPESFAQFNGDQWFVRL